MKKRSIKDWFIILVVLLDEVVVVALVFLVLWLLGIEIPLPVTITVALLLGALVFIMQRAVIPTLHKKRVTGSEGMIGLTGIVIEPLTPMGVIRVSGENWKARAVDENIAVDEEVEILELVGLTLKVGRKSD